MKLKSKPIKRDNNDCANAQVNLNMSANQDVTEPTIPMETGESTAKSLTNGSGHECPTCQKSFSRGDILRKHMKSHLPSLCNVCGQLFNDKFTLSKHQIEAHSSTAERVFQCPQCEKSFKELRTLRLHLKIHNAEYPERCPTCQKVFRTKWQLKQHQMDHGGERPYPCPECSFTCKTKQQLNEHRRKHSGEKAYSCQQCGTRFTYRNGLIKHTKLNRCPKKIITPDGETIIKKRSKTINVSKAKEKIKLPTQPLPRSVTQQGPGPLLNIDLPKVPTYVPNKSNPGNPPPPLESFAPESKLKTSLLEAQPVTMVSQPQPTPQNYVGLLQTVASAQVVHPSSVAHATTCASVPMPRAVPAMPPTSTICLQVLPQGGLTEGSISELTAATGLSAGEVHHWVSSLPPGSTVKITHHYDVKRRLEGVRPGKEVYGSTLYPQPSYQSLDPNAILQSRLSQNPPPDLLVENPHAIQLPSYAESFAVDPNEVLRKDIKAEDLGNLDYEVPQMSDRPRPLMATPRSTDPESPSSESLNGSVSSFGGSYSDLSDSSNSLNQGHPRKAHGLPELADISDDDFAMDLNTDNLNELDFHSIKSLVEQTFRDGRDMLDIFSSV